MADIIDFNERVKQLKEECKENTDQSELLDLAIEAEKKSLGDKYLDKQALADLFKKFKDEGKELVTNDLAGLRLYALYICATEPEVYYTEVVTCISRLSEYYRLKRVYKDKKEQDIYTLPTPIFCIIPNYVLRSINLFLIEEKFVNVDIIKES